MTPRSVPRSLLLAASLVAALAAGACNGGDPAPGADATAAPAEAERQLNVTLLLDLSDRVDPGVSPAVPSHRERDLAAVEAVVDAFVRDMRAKGAFEAEGRLRTIFSPPPADPAVNEIARSLAVDLRGMGPAEKKAVHDSLAARYLAGLGRIYDAVLSSSTYDGADLWRFFKDGHAANYAVADDPAFRNVLVVLTDGYAYHAQSTDREGNRTAYVTGPLLDREGLRRSGWRERFESGDYGLIDPGVALPDLEVLVLEVDPAEGHPNDLDVLRAYWSKWLDEMGVARYEVLQTDLPTNTAPLIRRFFDGG